MQVHGGNQLDIIEKYNIDKEKIIDFSASINPWGPPKGTMEALNSSLREVTHYPDLGARHLKAALSKYLDIPRDNILLGNGSSELIYLLATGLRPTKTLIVSPTFSEYEKAIAAQKGKIEHFFLKEQEDFVFHPERVENLQEGAVIFVCNPNNPTGMLSSADKILQLAERAARSKAYVVIDEAFMDFLEDKKGFTLIKEAVRRENLVVLGSLGKFFSLAGLRLGYLVASSSLVSDISRMQYPWNINSLAQAAGAAALKDQEFISTSLNLIKQEREFLFRELRAIPDLKPYPSSANFILVKLSETEHNADDLAEHLAARGILIRRASSFTGLNKSYFRLAVLDRNSNHIILNHIREFLQKRGVKLNEQVGSNHQND